MFNFIRNLFTKKTKLTINPKEAIAIYTVLESLGYQINTLEDTILHERNQTQIMLGAIAIQNGGKITVDNKFIDDMTEDMSLFVKLDKGPITTTITLEKQKDD